MDLAIAEQNKLLLDDLKRTKLLIVDRRQYSLMSIDNLLLNDINESIAEINRMRIAQSYPPDKYHVEVVNEYEDAIHAAEETMFDFFLFYKLKYENGKEAPDLIEKLANQSIDSFYLIAYRSKDKRTDVEFYKADTNLERIMSTRVEDCTSITEKIILECRDRATDGVLSHVVFVGDLHHNTMREVMEKLSGMRHLYEGLCCAVYENGILIEIKRKNRFFFF